MRFTAIVDEHDEWGLIRLDEAQCREFLGRHTLGRVAVVHMSHPQVFPVNYALDGAAVVFRTAPGTKLAAAVMGRPAVLEVDEADALFETGTSVMVHGALHLVTDPSEQERLRRLPIRPWAPGARDHLVRLEPGWITGRRIPMTHAEEGIEADGG